MKFNRIVITLLLLLVFTSPGLATEQVFYYITDPAGTPLAMTDDKDNVVWRADYKPFGEEQAVSGTADNSKRFVGKEKDEETGLSYFGARYEDARTGRFIAVDPVRVVDPMTSKTNEKILLNPQRLNVYAYALNNPYRYVDPDGRDIMVIENGPTKGNPIGHTAIAVTGSGVYSFGNNADPGTSVANYLWREAPRRDTYLYVLKTTEKQDSQATAYLKQFDTWKLPPGWLNALALDNCSTRSNNALDSANIPTSIANTNIPGSAGTRAYDANASTYKIPQGSKTLPAVIGRFEPK